MPDLELAGSTVGPGWPLETEGGRNEGGVEFRLQCDSLHITNPNPLTPNLNDNPNPTPNPNS